MSLTLEEIKEKLLRFYDPDDLLEALQISSEEIHQCIPSKTALMMIHYAKYTMTVVSVAALL